MDLSALVPVGIHLGAVDGEVGDWVAATAGAARPAPRDGCSLIGVSRLGHKHGVYIYHHCDGANLQVRPSRAQYTTISP